MWRYNLSLVQYDVISGIIGNLAKNMTGEEKARILHVKRRK